MRLALPMLGVLATGFLSGCQRSPAEDFGAGTASVPSRVAPVTSQGSVQEAPARASGQPTQAVPPGRCVRPTPAQEPPPVAPGPAPGCPPDPEGGGPKLPVVTVGFPDAGAALVQAEVVTSPHDTQRGLMYRRSMPMDHGMLFDLRTRSDHEFWMHNTCIALDLLYADEDGLLVGIVENAPTLDDSPRSVGCMSRYVLEVNAGWSRRHGVKAGQHMTIPAL